MNIFPKFVMYGHHKCATMWLNTIAGAVCKRIGLHFKPVYDEFEFNQDLHAYCSKQEIDFLSYGNADMQFSRSLPEHRGFHIIRDPRDIVISAYFSHRNSHSTKAWNELEPHRAKLQNMDKHAGIAEEMRFRERSFRHMHSWNYAQEHILEIRFEELIDRHYETLLTVFNHLGLLSQADYRFMSRPGGMYRELAALARSKMNITLPRFTRRPILPAAEFLTIVWRNRFEAKTHGRNRGDEDVDSHYRRGKSGDWKNHFSPEHKALFKKLYPGLVPDLGYADSDNW